MKQTTECRAIYRIFSFSQLEIVTNSKYYSITTRVLSLCFPCFVFLNINVPSLDLTQHRLLHSFLPNQTCSQNNRLTWDQRPIVNSIPMTSSNQRIRNQIPTN